jgi:DsbC/DsbD-like thiol-disulfide interchange protein
MTVPERFFRIARALPLAAGAILCMTLAAAIISAVAAPPSASPWAQASNSKARLVSGTVEIAGEPNQLAGVQLRMDQGWKTYWRSPGDSGVPPGFDWSGSKNLKHAEVLFPAPIRFADGNSTAVGYAEEVVFPVKITPERAGEPVELKLGFDFGICMDLCVPNQVALSLTLPPGGSGTRGDALIIESALSRVPQQATPGTLPRVVAVETRLDGAAPELVVEVEFAADATSTDLFIEAPGVFVPVPNPIGPVENGKQRFAVGFKSAAEAQALKGKPLTLTLVSAEGSTETIWKPEPQS